MPGLIITDIRHKNGIVFARKLWTHLWSYGKFSPNTKKHNFVALVG